MSDLDVPTKDELADDLRRQVADLTRRLEEADAKYFETVKAFDADLDALQAKLAAAEEKYRKAMHSAAINFDDATA